MRRYAATVLLWLLGAALLFVLVLRGGPWLWPRLFPATVPPVPAQAAVEEGPTPAFVAEVLGRTLAAWGRVLPDGDGVIELPPGHGPADLQAVLRAEPRLSGLQVHVTRRGELESSLRVFDGPRLLLRRTVRPWLLERPVLPQGRRVPLGILVLVHDEAPLLRLGGWKAPLAMVLPPFAPFSARAARQASWDGKGIVILVDPAEDLVPQSRALREAGGVLLTAELPAGFDPSPWFAALAGGRRFLLDGRQGAGEGLVRRAREAGVVAARLAGRVAAGDDRRLAWALTQRRGAGVVLAEASHQGLEELEGFVEASRDVGFTLVLPAEALSARRSPGAP